MPQRLRRADAPPVPLWDTLEADDAELHAHVSTLLHPPTPATIPEEPDRVRQAFDASWPHAFAEADGVLVAAW